MDVFGVSKTDFKSTGPIDGIEKITWVERYNEPGEFTIVGNPVPLMANLPLGLFISHTNSDDIMVVEEHLIDESQDNEEGTKVKIMGTSLIDYVMKNRVVTRRSPYDDPDTFWSYSGYYEFARKAAYYETGPVTISVDNLLLQLLTNHLTNATGENENFTDIIVMNYGISTDNLFGNYVSDRLPYLSEAVFKILLEADVGLKAVRPGPNRLYLEDPDLIAAYYSGADDPTEMVFFVLHMGNDLSSSVIFDINNGDVHNARYLWSNKGQKNAWYGASGDFVQRQFDGEDLDPWDRKVGRIDLGDYTPFDESEGYEVLIWGGIDGRGREAKRLSNSKGLIVDAVGSKNAGPKYGINYRVGDIVRVFGNYGVNQNMRVSEVALVQDGSDETVVPTLKPVYIEPYTPPE